MNNDQNPEDIKADIKHDTMEFSAATDGDDKLDTDDGSFEEDTITAEELEALEDNEANEAAALVAEQNDFELDDSNLPDEDWTDDLPDNEARVDQRDERS